MRILIVTAWYHPFIHPRAHRWAALAEHWAGEGHEVQVLTGRVRERGRSEVVNGVQVHRVGFDSLKEWFYFWLGSRKARGRVGAKPAEPGLAERLAAWVYKGMWKNIFFPDDACVWYFPARRKLRQLLASEKFDALITVSLPFTGHMLGLATRPTAQSRRTSERWLADIGDPFSFQAATPNNRFFFQKKNLRLERKVLETADAVAVTNKAMLRNYREQFGEKAVAKMTVVPPLLAFSRTAPTGGGWPLASLPRPGRVIENQSPNSQFPITKVGYFGALYAPTRTPDAFLELLAQTFLLRPEWRNRMEIHFFGEIFPEFFEKLNAEPTIRLHGLRSREEAWAAMQEMDILLSIGNTTDFQLPSKVVDYLASGKPAVHLSYVEHDPSAGFFEGMGVLFFNLKIENGKPEKGELARWLRWLESPKPTLSKAEIAERVAPFLVGNIARQYLALLD